MKLRLAAGLAAGIAALAAAQLVSALLRERTNLVQAVAEAIRDLTPGPVAEKLIHLVGSLDKPLLVGGIVVVVLGLSAWAGRSRWGALVFIVLGVVGAIAAISRPGAATSAMLPALAATIVGVAVLATLRGSEVGESHDRRAFLRNAGLVVAGSAIVAAGSVWVGKARRAAEEARDRLKLAATRGTVPAGADLDIDGQSWRVSNDDFYRIDTAFSVPTIDPAEWTLRIHGMVDHEIDLTYADLLERQQTEAWITLCCVSNPVGGELIGNAWWSGVRIAPLLVEAGVDADADMVLQTSHDGWSCGTPLEVLTDDRNAMLAVAMNGEPLPLEHGFPVRTVVPGLYGYVSATKWVVDLEVTRFDKAMGYWTDKGWSAKGPVKTQSRIDVPRGDVDAGTVKVAGVAWAQHTGIAKVEIKLDDGDWQECGLGRVESVDTWVQWQTTVECDAGDHEVAVRATDRSGYTQTSERTDVAPDGATGWHTVSFSAA